MSTQDSTKPTWIPRLPLPLVVLLALALIPLGFIATARLILWSGSNADHGDTLDEFLTSVCDEEYEFFAFFDLNENKLFEYTNYDKHQVSLPTAYLNAATFLNPRGIIVAHNHPEDNAAHSINDIIFSMEHNQILTSIVVSSHKVYTLSAPNGWPNVRDFIATYDPRIADQEARNQQVGNYIRKNWFIPDENNENSFYSGQAFLEAVADDYSLVFTVNTINRSLVEPIY